MAGRGTWHCASTVVLLVLAASVTHAEVRTDVAHAAGGTSPFKFDQVPPPSRSDAASKATITVVDGTRDRNGGDVGVLNDGVIPRADDQPRANFFFAAGTDGGRLLVDLGSVID